MSVLMAPPAIIFINTDLSAQVQSVIVSQLFISETIDGYEFDARVAADPNYPTVIHNAGLRILVLRPLSDFNNRALADIVLFAKAGLITVEFSKFGPPGITLPIARVYLSELFNLNKSPGCVPKHRHHPVLDNDLIHPHGGLSILRDEERNDDDE
jgi:hypothetical protein